MMACRLAFCLMQCAHVLAVVISVVSAQSCATQCRCEGTTMDCSHGALPAFPTDLLIPSSTKILVMSDNLMTRVPPTPAIPNLLELNLEDNFITELRSNSFRLRPNLQILRLGGNKIIDVTNSAFDGLSQLLKLYLNRNNIETIEAFGSLSGPSSLELLDLQKNKLTSISIGTFTGIPLLTELNLSSNNISKIEDGSFGHLKKLRVLYLNSNQILKLTNATFFGMSSLNRLTLSNNKIQNLPDMALKGAGSLEFLDLTSNSISTITQTAFSGLLNLTALSLSTNNISSVEDGAFRDLVKLNSLSLWDNNLQDISASTFLGLAPEDRTDNTGLEVLYLAGNRLTTIRKDDFARLTKLTFLTLFSLARLEDESDIAIAGAIRDIRVQHTDQRPSAVADADRRHLSNHRNKRRSRASRLMSAEEPHPNSDVTAPSYRPSNDRYNLRNRKRSLPSPEQRTHPATKKQNAERFQRNDITNEGLEDGSFANLGNLVYLSLYANPLTNISAATFEGLVSLESLGIGNNQIRNYPPFAFANMPSLTTINLSSYGSTRFTLHPDTFGNLAALRHLNIAGVTSVWPGVFRHLPCLQTVWMGGRLTCDCDILDLATWLNRTAVTVRPFDTSPNPVACARHNPSHLRGVPVMNLREEDLRMTCPATSEPTTTQSTVQICPTPSPATEVMTSSRLVTTPSPTTPLPSSYKTTQPGTYPVITETCSYPVDLVFLLDSSESFRTSGFEDAKTFIQSVVNYFTLGENDTRVGVVTYSNVDAQVTRVKLNENYTRVELLTEIRNIPYDRGHTFTGLGLDHVRNNSFLEVNGGRNDTPDVLVVLTDDDSEDDVTRPAQLLRQMGIKVFVVGVGTESDISQPTLEAIAGTPDRVFRLTDHDNLVDAIHPIHIRQAICNATPCPPLTVPTNGALTPPSPHNYPVTVTFSCNSGYELNGAENTTCQTDRTWSNPVPTCSSGQCSTLAAPTNGARTPAVGATSFGNTVTFFCSMGYTLNGATTATCQTNGTWSNPVPTCTPRSCPPLTTPTNGALSLPGPAYSYPNQVTVTCNWGYQLSGISSVTCLADGTWSNVVPTCTMTCPEGYGDDYGFGKCLYVHKRPLIYSDAQAFCHGMGGKIFQFDNAEDVNRIKTIFERSRTSRRFGIWVGLTEGTFVWADGTPLVSGDFSDWAPQQYDRNSDKRDCVVMKRRFNWQWVVGSCSRARNLFLCEPN
ncbi:uncharacterized protein LOC144863042 [Branchiostoma floridae x Branchiostoma japonicum]